MHVWLLVSVALASSIFSPFNGVEPLHGPDVPAGMEDNDVLFAGGVFTDAAADSLAEEEGLLVRGWSSTEIGGTVVLEVGYSTSPTAPWFRTVVLTEIPCSASAGPVMNGVQGNTYGVSADACFGGFVVLAMSDTTASPYMDWHLDVYGTQLMSTTRVLVHTEEPAVMNPAFTHTAYRLEDVGTREIFTFTSRNQLSIVRLRLYDPAGDLLLEHQDSLYVGNEEWIVYGEVESLGEVEDWLDSGLDCSAWRTLEVSATELAYSNMVANMQLQVGLWQAVFGGFAGFGGGEVGASAGLHGALQGGVSFNPGANVAGAQAVAEAMATLAMNDRIAAIDASYRACVIHASVPPPSEESLVSELTSAIEAPGGSGGAVCTNRKVTITTHEDGPGSYEDGGPTEEDNGSGTIFVDGRRHTIESTCLD